MDLHRKSIVFKSTTDIVKIFMLRCCWDIEIKKFNIVDAKNLTISCAN